MKYVVLLDVPDDQLERDGGDSIENACRIINDAVEYADSTTPWSAPWVSPLSETFAC